MLLTKNVGKSSINVRYGPKSLKRKMCRKSIDQRLSIQLALKVARSVVKGDVLIRENIRKA